MVDYAQVAIDFLSDSPLTILSDPKYHLAFSPVGATSIRGRHLNLKNAQACLGRDIAIRNSNPI